MWYTKESLIANIAFELNKLAKEGIKKEDIQIIPFEGIQVGGKNMTTHLVICYFKELEDKPEEFKSDGEEEQKYNSFF